MYEIQVFRDNKWTSLKSLGYPIRPLKDWKDARSALNMLQSANPGVFFRYFHKGKPRITSKVVEECLDTIRLYSDGLISSSEAIMVISSVLRNVSPKYAALLQPMIQQVENLSQIWGG